MALIAFYGQKECVYCAVRTESWYIIRVNFSLLWLKAPLFPVTIRLFLHKIYRLDIGLKFGEETSKMLHLEHGFIWC